MPQKKYCSSALALFFANLRRFWPLSLCFFIALLWIGPLRLMYVNVMYYLDDPRALNMSLLNIIGDMTRGLTVVVFIAALAAGAFVFMYKFGSRSANFHLALPVKREGQFLAAALTQLAVLFVPLLLAFPLLWPALANTGANVSDFAPDIWRWLAIGGVSLMVFSAIASFGAVLAGNIFGYAAFYAGLSYGVYVLHLAFRHFLMGSVFGLYLPGVSATPLTPLDYLHNHHETVSPLVLALYALSALAIFALALLIYRRQRAEAAGDIVAARAAKPVLRIFAVIAGALSGYYIFGKNPYSYTNATRFLPAVLITVPFGALSYWIVEMLLQKTLRVFSKRFFARAGIAAACVMAGCAVACTGLLGLSSSLPNEAEVVAAYFNTGSLHDLQSPDYEIAMRGGYWYDAEYRYYSRRNPEALPFPNEERFDKLNGDLARYMRKISPFIVEERESIARLTRFHRAILLNEAELRSISASPNAQYRTVSLAYLLNDGSVIERQYIVPESFETELLVEILDAPETRNKRFTLGGAPFTDFEVDAAFMINLPDGRGADSRYGDSSGPSPDLSKEAAMALCSAIMKDAAEGNFGGQPIFADESGDYYAISIDLYIRSPELNEMGRAYNFGIYVPKQAENTLRWFIDNGRFSEADLPLLAQNASVYVPAHLGGVRVGIY